MKPPPICVYCLASVPRGKRVLELSIAAKDAERIVLRWHLDGCAGSDPLHLALAEAVGLPDGDEGDDATARAYLAIVDRLRAVGVAELRAAVDVRRDLPDVRYTLRGPGDLWGRRVRR